MYPVLSVPFGAMHAPTKYEQTLLHYRTGTCLDTGETQNPIASNWNLEEDVSRLFGNVEEMVLWAKEKENRNSMDVISGRVAKVGRRSSTKEEGYNKLRVEYHKKREK